MVKRADSGDEREVKRRRGAEPQNGAQPRRKKLTHDDYTVGWVCPLEVELIAALEMLDEEHAPLPQPPTDHNKYYLGSIAGHNVVIASLPQAGNVPAAAVVTQMRIRFPSVWFALLVGIGGGVPKITDNGMLRLGHVAVSQPVGPFSGVIQYDHGKALGSVFERTGALAPPPVILLLAAQSVADERARSDHDYILENVYRIDTSRPRMRHFRFPGVENDRLFQADYKHLSPGVSCNASGFDIARCTPREMNEDNQLIVVHRGTVASGELVLRDSVLRDQLAKHYGILCFEMEAAGVVADFPCLVIRGITDYCDSHKNDQWHGFSAAAAALSSAEYLRRRQEGTGKWLFKADKFLKWESEKGVLFCPGIPGAGKTIVTSTVIDYLQRKYESSSGVGIAFIFCNFNQQQNQKLDNILANILGQLVRGLSCLPDALRSFYTNHERMGMVPCLSAILEMLRIVSGIYDHTYVIIDALDECSNSDRGRDHLIPQVLDLQRGFNMSFMATSRFILDIASKFEEFPSIEIRTSDGDVRKYVTDNLPPSIQRRPDMRKVALSDIVRKSDGMFLLAKLFVDSLQGKYTTRAIKRALEDLKAGSNAYEDAYRATMKRIEEQTADRAQLAKRALAWLTCAARTLTLTELQHALAVVVGESSFDEENLPDIEELISACAGLIAYNEENHIIRLVHLTAHEYLEKTWTIWFPKAHYDIGEACVTYLSYDDFQAGIGKSISEYQERCQRYPLYRYAAEEWGYHASKQPLTLSLLLELLQSYRKVAAFVPILFDKCGFEADTEEELRGTTALHVVAIFGLEREAEALIRLGHEVDPINGMGWTPFSLALMESHVGLAKLLLQEGANPFHEVDSLYYAARDGQLSMVNLLVEAGVDVNTANCSDRPPLVAAATYGYEEVVRLLIDAGAKANYKDGCLEHTALCSAAERGHLAVVQLLVDRGADLNYIGKNGMTPLGNSARHGHRDIVEFLLKRGAELDTSNDHAPLWMASASGHIDVASLLLTAGAKKDLIIGGRTALGSAIKISHTALVQLLLSRGADPNIHHPGNSPLSNAIERGNVEIVELLLKHGASPCPEALDALTKQKGNKALFNVLKKYGVLHKLGAPHDTLILWAARRGYVALVEILLDQNADINIRDSLSGDTPLLCAVAHCGDVLHAPPRAYSNRGLLGGRELVALLIEKKADLEISDMHGRTPLLNAAKRGDAAMVQLLLDKGANTRSTDNMGQTALVFGIQNGNENILDSLLTHDPGLISVRDKFGRSPLLLSVGKKCGALIAHHIGNESSHRELTELIIDEIEIILRTIRSTGVDVSPEEGAMLMAWAATNGYLTVVEVLLEMNVKADHEDEFTRIPFLQAIADNHLAVVDLFLQKCHNPNETDQEGRSALSWGFYSRNEAIVQLLLERGADPNSNIKRIIGYWEGPWNRQSRWKFRNSAIEWPPLFEAAAMGFERCVRFLLQVCTNPGITIVQKKDSLGDQSTDNALSLAVEWKHYRIVEMLLAHGVDDDQCHSSLALAMQLNDQKLVTILTQRIGSKWLIAEHGKSLLFQAAYSGYTEIVSSLLNSGMEPDTATGYTSCSILMYRFLASDSPYRDKLSDSDTPLVHACRQGHRAVVQLLLERGADANLVSPFDCAGETIFSLLQFGVKIDIGKEGHILFFDAVEAGNSSLVKRFLKMGVCPEPKDHQQMHPLFIAVSNANMDVLRVLLDSGMDPNTKDRTGRTCLCLAAEKGLPLMVEFLMQSGCQPRIGDNLGRTPLFFATLNAHKAVVELLVLKANADANATTCEPGEPLAIGQQVSGGE
ncbi:hypothetical protein CNMCM5793_007523 [Aspergillus hiratsukae]|uniref:Nucleoside phosphorylase domain-containing protein n=1 Tax=Aspergillus hiratsukae TaxID=1194566 RepID=A0A8H6Q3W9_9EURO|nr:hypothetical protein CNMCM5793_007523 [Aspergillus hiratsukae]KAF7166031.1 hypothetical protein CNMCM6106_001972 [Aspergillus hiratsukae]